MPLPGRGPAGTTILKLNKKIKQNEEVICISRLNFQLINSTYTNMALTFISDF